MHRAGKKMLQIFIKNNIFRLNIKTFRCFLILFIIYILYALHTHLMKCDNIHFNFDCIEYDDYMRARAYAPRIYPTGTQKNTELIHIFLISTLSINFARKSKLIWFFRFFFYQLTMFIMNLKTQNKAIISTNIN